MVVNWLARGMPRKADLTSAPDVEKGGSAIRLIALPLLMEIYGTREKPA